MCNLEVEPDRSRPREGYIRTGRHRLDSLPHIVFHVRELRLAC